MADHGQPLFTSVFSSQPPAFVEILTFAFSVFGDSVVVGRGVMVFFYLLSLAATGAVAWRIAGPFAGPLAILLLGLPLLYFRQASIVEAEVPALALALLCLAILVWPAPGHMRVLGAGFLFTAGVL